MNINATIFGQSIAFIIFIYICYKFIWPHLIGAIEERQKYISDSLSAAAQAQEEAAKTSLDNKKVLDDAKSEARVIIDNAKARADQIVEESRAEALRVKQEIEEQGRQQLAIDIASAQHDLRKEISTLAILSAEKILNKEVDKAVNDELINQFLNKLDQEQNG